MDEGHKNHRAYYCPHDPERLSGYRKHQRFWKLEKVGDHGPNDRADEPHQEGEAEPSASIPSNGPADGSAECGNKDVNHDAR